MDGRRNNGGHSTKGRAGRKPKTDEQALLEKLSIYEDTAHAKLREAVENGDQWAIKLYFEYYYGKPSQTVNHQNNGGSFEGQPLNPAQIDKLIDKL
jgi:hypothetical protein